MGLKEKLLYEKNEESGKKKISKKKIIGIIIIILIIIISANVLNNKLHENDSMQAQISAYNILPNNTTLDEKVDYIITNYGVDEELRYGGYINWLSRSGVDVNNNWAIEDIFYYYDTNANGIWDKNEIKSFLKPIEVFKNTVSTESEKWDETKQKTADIKANSST
ncbi:hypothetical protein SDC9_30528 [bioreactor metagenome]|uniref:EF-hand domain-containing protein n=1 Tax=bioreactor metagenome TaxID=1076179 RepID=A0A644V0Y5_9ZZZZ|nr:hypothetical protein [Methanobrevibacter sp.]MEA4957539.1 hypothetical protein [Methanobrevibacter sp.]